MGDSNAVARTVDATVSSGAARRTRRAGGQSSAGAEEVGVHGDSSAAAEDVRMRCDSSAEAGDVGVLLGNSSAVVGCIDCIAMENVLKAVTQVTSKEPHDKAKEGEQEGSNGVGGGVRCEGLSLGGLGVDEQEDGGARV